MKSRWQRWSGFYHRSQVESLPIGVSCETTGPPTGFPAPSVAAVSRAPPLRLPDAGPRGPPRRPPGRRRAGGMVGPSAAPHNSPTRTGGHGGHAQASGALGPREIPVNSHNFFWGGGSAMAASRRLAPAIRTPPSAAASRSPSPSAARGDPPSPAGGRPSAALQQGCRKENAGVAVALACPATCTAVPLGVPPSPLPPDPGRSLRAPQGRLTPRSATSNRRPGLQGNPDGGWGGFWGGWTSALAFFEFLICSIHI